ncbi:hypothetical protein MAM1_0331c09754 [Mucor ambiguus]|uniref:Uncharacterized protein n=1 Tax=Mucor ambiguus TaxID=91626 RepID=A0A0C9MHJ2_9FUNG|nr:hypothetical protein MAM1_0331c09754 [Mucor ambiguus]
MAFWRMLINIDLVRAGMNSTARKFQPRSNSMSVQKDGVIDEELFQCYLQFRLRQIQKSMLLSDDSSEKEAMVNILTSCQHVNGNTLRMVFCDIFDKSVQTFTYAEPILAPAIKPVVISTREKRKHSTDYAESTITALNRNEAAPLHDDTDNGDEHTAESDQDGEVSVYLDSSSEEIRKKKLRVINNSPSVPSSIKHLITKIACTDLEAMLKNLQVTKDIFRSRMNMIKNTFKIYYTPSSASSSYTAPKCRFEINSRFSYKSSMGQCQLNMIAYQLGKIEEIEKEMFSPKQVKKNRLKYYQDLSVSLNESKLAYTSHLREFPRHCERALYVVQNLGAYVLFMPEILPPTTYKKIQNSFVPVLKAFLEGRCSPFKDIARFDDKDRLIVSESTGDLEKFLKKGKPYYSRFVDFSG